VKNGVISESLLAYFPFFVLKFNIIKLIKTCKLQTLYKIGYYKSMKYTGRNNESFQVIDIDESNCEILKESKKSDLSLLWFTSDNNQIRIDSKVYTFNTNEIIFITEFHRIEVIAVNTLMLLRFNKPFYCILDHDSEVGCKGILYYGSATLPRINLMDKDFDVLNAVWKVLEMELAYKDELQLEMLQMMLKRVLILSTRIYKKQLNFQEIDNLNSDIIREFNFLVETHFREKHNVVDYAELLYKAPKTLANLFKKLGNKTPLQFIQDRLILESERLLRYTDKSVSEIGYELGFNEVQSFSRFFKNLKGVSPLDFRQSN